MATSAQTIPSKPTRNGTLMVLLAFGVLPAVVLLVLSWVDVDPPERGLAPTPVWVSPGILRGTTADGLAVKASVMIDAANSSTKMALERKLSQVGLVLQTSLGSKTQQELTGSKGLLTLSDDMLKRLNLYLRQQDTAPARAVVIQDFLIGSP